MRPIRLTYLITDLKRGGVPLHLYRLATRLPREQFDLHVISLDEVGPVGEMLQSDGISVSACGARSAADLGALVRLRRLLRARRPDVLHSLLFHANMAARVVGPTAGVCRDRIICEIQTAEIERRWHLVLDNLSCRLCRFEAGNSASVIEHLHRAAHIPLGRLRLMPSGVDVESVATAPPATREKLGVPDGVPLVIWTGRLDPVKGFEEMLAAFRRVSEVSPARLVLAGEGEYRPVVERLIREHGLTERVRLLGQRTDIPSLLRASDLFLFCSRTEGLPNALLEAMAAGLPIVATDVPGCRDVIQSEETGLLAPARDARAIADAVLRLFSDPALAKSCGGRAQEWVRQHFNSEVAVRRWLEVYESVALGRS